MDEDLDFATMSAYQLIEYLDAGYPHLCIQPNQTLEDAHRYAGARALIDQLMLAKKAEEEARDEGHE